MTHRYKGFNQKYAILKLTVTDILIIVVMAVLSATVYRAHWEDPLTRLFEQLFGPLEWNTLAIQDHHQCVWYSYFHPYPIWVSNSTIPVNHSWQTQLQAHQLSKPVTLTFHHQPPDFVNAITQYSKDCYSGGVKVVSDNLDCTITQLLNFSYQPVFNETTGQVPRQASLGAEHSLEVPPELVSVIHRWMAKASKSVVQLSAQDPHWYQQRLQWQPVDGRWWHQVIHQHQQLIELLRVAVSSGTIACDEIQQLLPFKVPATTITLTTPASTPIIHIPEHLLTQHHHELIKLTEIVNDPRATTLLLSGVLDSGQLLADHSGKIYPVIPTFEGGRMLRVQGDSPIIINYGKYHANNVSNSVPPQDQLSQFPMILDSDTEDLSPYSTEQLNSLLRYINGLQDSDGSGNRKYVLLQNRIVHNLACRRQYPNLHPHLQELPLSYNN